MKTIINAKLKKNSLSRESDDLYVQIINIESFGLEDIINELVKENPELNSVVALKTINAFNQKIIELVATGNQVNTGLVNLYPTIKGSIAENSWNPVLNRVDTIITQGIELGRALFDTNIQLYDEQGNELEIIDQAKKLMDMKLQNKSNTGIETSKFNQNTEPPCGMAFRKWLCNS